MNKENVRGHNNAGPVCAPGNAQDGKKEECVNRWLPHELPKGDALRRVVMSEVHPNTKHKQEKEKRFFLGSQ